MYHTPRSSRSNRFKKDLKLMAKRGKNIKKFVEIANLLAMQIPLPERYRDHQLKGEFKNFRECHIEPDWLLIYRFIDSAVVFERTGAHADLFE